MRAKLSWERAQHNKHAQGSVEFRFQDSEFNEETMKPLHLTHILYKQKVSFWRANMLQFLAVDMTCSEKRTVS